jgi:predicted NUDIX family phosphoesterase
LTEQVLAIDTYRLEELATCSGLLAFPLESMKELINEYGKYVLRSQAESDESIRQIIPYVVFREERCFLLMKRTRKQGEARLHEKYSIGVGGHINPEDGPSPWSAFVNGMEREISEEVDAEVSELEYLGVLNDLSTPVSRVHLGMVYIADTVFCGFNEKDKFEGSMESLETLREYREKMETWSQIVLEKLK